MCTHIDSRLTTTHPILCLHVHVHSASKYGIYTLLDAHQDVLSQKFCGEGIPDWAVDTGCKKLNQTLILNCLRIRSYVASSPGHSHIFNVILRDDVHVGVTWSVALKIWEWPGDEASGYVQLIFFLLFISAAMKFPEPLDTPFENDPNTSHPLPSVSTHSVPPGKCPLPGKAPIYHNFKGYYYCSSFHTKCVLPISPVSTYVGQIQIA